MPKDITLKKKEIEKERIGFSLFIGTVCFIDLGKIKLLMVVSILSSSQCSLLSQMPQNLMLDTILSMNDTKIIFSQK
jgi:hypothetical protein